MIVSAEEVKPESVRTVLCDTYENGCGKPFTVPVSRFNPAGDQICPACTQKRNERANVQARLKAARQFGSDEVQALENELDRIDGYDWREVVGRTQDRVMRQRERRMPDGSVY